jgi:uncharacterized protein
MNRAYSTLKIRSVDKDQRIIEGTASTPDTDRVGDILESRGAQFRLPFPFLWQHRHDQPIGTVEYARVTSSGITIRARIAQDDEPGPLKNLLDLAWSSIKQGLVKGLSVGFRPLSDPEPIRGSTGVRYQEWEILETSAVTIPANSACTISAVKHYARIGSRAPAGLLSVPPLPPGSVRLVPPGSALLYSKESMRRRGSRPLGGQ